MKFTPADSASRKGRSRGDSVATSAVRQRREAGIAQERGVLPQKPGTATADRAGRYGGSPLVRSPSLKGLSSTP